MKDIIIIGSGPAGHTASIYSARAGLSTLLFEGWMAGGVAPGGQLTTTNEIENFPGFPDVITGPQLMADMKKQAEGQGVEFLMETVESVDFSSRPFKVKTSSREEEAQAVIIATGATAKRMHVPHEEDFWQKGISACAVCDGALPIFRNQPLVVIGGGDTAMEEAMHLSKFGSKVYIVHRRDELRASQAMQDRVLANEKIEVLWSTVLVDVGGENTLDHVILKNVKTGEEFKQEAKGLFYAIGHKPNTDFLGGVIDTDEDGYIVTEKGTTKTSIPGVFAAGDVQDKVYRQAITSAGTGCMAALDAEKFIGENPM
ncbi:thioredoxin-disulfide reductase [Spirochaeta isovalerica]|uniref:Thioredoxin reductase n=1 Tax=Spirochaeta isovalerica TaxID=150 RepID=A0A841RDR2_9SPIO|nr:thioredoxin-disulfide reductase [Spirochaeta isovalerica]MBB6480512.1 thioredoxin reductase (NADPH) [Spirochaeta isovalerica]